MTDNFRHRREAIKMRHLPVASATVVEIGDLVWIDTNEAKPASSFTWDTNIATTQNAFVAKFLGMSQNRSRVKDTEYLRVETSGVKDFDCASATFVLGDLVGPAKATGDALENQKVVAVATSNLAIGRVAKHYSIATTRVEVELFGILGSMLGAGGGENIVAKIASTGTHLVTTTAQVSKLDNINLGATTATDNEIVALVEAANPKLTADAIADGTTNKVFTAAEETKLVNINLGATADTDDEIVALVEAANPKLTADAIGDGVTNKAFTAIEDTKLSNINLGATADTDDEIVALVEAANPKLTADAIQDGTTNKAFTAIEETKLNNINLGATTDTDDEIVALVEAANPKLTADAIQDGTTNKAFTAIEDTKLSNINLGATADTDDEIVALVEAANPKLTADAIQDGTTNKAFTAIEETKLSNINLGATADTDDEIVALVEAANPKLTADAIGDGTTNKVLTATQKGYIPSVTEKEALAGSHGTPGSANKYVTETDPKATKQVEVEIIQNLATSTTLAFAVPVNAKIIDFKFRVDVEVTSPDAATNWKATLAGGSTEYIVTDQALIQNTKPVWSGLVITTDATNLVIASDTGTINGGTIRATVRYIPGFSAYDNIV